MTAPARPVVFIHGLWLHATSWAPWLDLFSQHGYQPEALGWPGDAETVEQTRAHAEALNGVGIDEVTAHHARRIRDLPSAPIVVGHSFGGLIAEKLLSQGLARGAVAMAPTQFKGILTIPKDQLASAWPILSKPWLRNRTWTHTADSFATTFASGVSRAESDRIFQRFTIPAPCRPLFQAALANAVPRSPARVDLRADRGPLLLIGGGLDRTVPASTVRAAYQHQRRNPAVTELEIIEEGGHSIPVDSHWAKAADLALAFLSRNGL